jgi:hypothetical protein
MYSQNNNNIIKRKKTCKEAMESTEKYSLLIRITDVIWLI